jgi:excisionase family DNA binding protein
VSAAGFEPTTPGSGARFPPSQPLAKVSKPLEIQGLRAGAPCRVSQPEAPIIQKLGATVVPVSPPCPEGDRGKVTLLTVPECAVALRVSAATIYRLVGEGQLSHLRVSNAIRIREQDLAAFLETQNRRVQ